jgi:hypothetical protein
MQHDAAAKANWLLVPSASLVCLTKWSRAAMCDGSLSLGLTKCYCQKKEQNKEKHIKNHVKVWNYLTAALLLCSPFTGLSC